ncbi:MAG: hypothetical protein WC005_01435 [Candidatus Nanopelagicales bacterium]
MSTKAPWWFTGDEPQARGFDLGGLATSAQFMIDWARESLLSSHQGHVDPADHPQCLLCRTMGLFSVPPDGPADDDGAGFEWIELDPPR